MTNDIRVDNAARADYYAKTGDATVVGFMAHRIAALEADLAARDAVIAEVTSLVMNTDGDWLGIDTFGGLTGEIQRALALPEVSE